MATSTQPSGLYARLLADSWAGLAESVRGLHCTGAAVRGAGLMRVSRGTNWLARCLAALLRLPAAGVAVPVTLLITPTSDVEEWRRTFAGRPMVTWQSPSPGGLLVERAGLAELCFRLEVRDGGLIYHPAGAALRLGRLRVPLPRWLAPSVEAHEAPAGQLGRTEVSVRVSLPVLGLLISYEGLMAREPEGT
jgi:hypothetical protein